MTRSLTQCGPTRRALRPGYKVGLLERVNFLLRETARRLVRTLHIGFRAAFVGDDAADVVIVSGTLVGAGDECRVFFFSVIRCAEFGQLTLRRRQSVGLCAVSGCGE